MVMATGYTWTQQYTAEQGEDLSWTDPSDTLTRGQSARWIQSLEEGDITVVQDGGNEDVLTFAAGETKSGNFVGVVESEVDFLAGNGDVPSVPGGVQGGTGPTGPTGPTGATGATGPVFTPVATKTSAYTASADEIVPVDPTGGAFTLTLPATSAGNNGHPILVHNVSTSATSVTVVPVSGTINGLTSTSIAASKGSKIFYSDFAHTDWIAFTSA